MNTIPIELNTHFAPNEVSIQCGSAAYTIFLGKQDDIRRRFTTNQQVSWYITVKRRGKTHISYINVHKKQITTSQNESKRTLFTSYEEAREIANELMHSEMFYAVNIVECYDRIYQCL
jgi:hypothetical protein